MKEIFKDIEGYENLYQISDQGKVKALGNGGSNASKERILKPAKEKNGYMFVKLCKQGKQKNYYVHRLVASAFIENPNNHPEINHRDEDKTNNTITNLEWCTHFYNVNYGTRTERAKDKQKIVKGKKILCVTTNTIYNSIKEASQILNMSSSSICHCCKGKNKSCGGLKWKYVS